MNTIRHTISLTCNVPTYDQFSGMIGELMIKNPDYKVDSISFYPNMEHGWGEDKKVEGYEGSVTLVNETPGVTA